MNKFVIDSLDDFRDVERLFGGGSLSLLVAACSHPLPPVRREDMCYGELCLGIIRVLLQVKLKKRLEPCTYINIKMAEGEPKHKEEPDPEKAYREMIIKIVVPILVEKGYTVYINEDNVIEISDENGYPLE